jgi:RNA-directed DNA polymerase
MQRVERPVMTTGLECIAAKARDDRKLKFTSLAHHVTEEPVWESVNHIPNNSAPGCDGQTVEEAKQSFKHWAPESKPRLRGEAHLVRYIDDFVICFQYRDDADRVQAVLSKRLNKCALALEPSKTKLIKFGRFAQREARVQGERPETFAFLGFTHYGTRNRNGNYKVGRKTEKSRLRRSMTNLTALMRDIRHWSLKDQVFRLNQVLRGHYAYYGVAGNWRSLHKVYRFVERYWHKMLCSRSWAARLTWAVFRRLRDLFPIQRPTIYLTYGQMQACAVL